MVALPTNEEILEQYFQSDDEDSEFEGFSEPESDVDIPNALNSSDEEPPDSDDDSENDDETWTDRFRNVEIQDFTQATGPVENIALVSPRLLAVPPCLFTNSDHTTISFIKQRTVQNIDVFRANSVVQSYFNIGIPAYL
jgi:hypothetical protein